MSRPKKYNKENTAKLKAYLKRNRGRIDYDKLCGELGMTRSNAISRIHQMRKSGELPPRQNIVREPRPSKKQLKSYENMDNRNKVLTAIRNSADALSYREVATITGIRSLKSVHEAVVLLRDEGLLPKLRENQSRRALPAGEPIVLMPNSEVLVAARNLVDKLLDVLQDAENMEQVAESFDTLLDLHSTLHGEPIDAESE